MESKVWKIKAFIGPGIALSSIIMNPKLYSLVLTDIRTPEMSGIEFVRKLRNMDNNIKLIFMTAFETEIDELRVERCGAFEKTHWPRNPGKFNQKT